MSQVVIFFVIYILPVSLVMGLYIAWSRAKSRAATRRLEESIESGLSEPASLHPHIDSNLCLGCGACVSACPEGEILGLIDRRAQLVSPASCIGHGACQQACPVRAISLVFGTAKRGVEIPMLSPDFETNVPGIFIAGELGGMGLIKNAIFQGVSALQALASKHLKPAHDFEYDVAIVGAGPAGLSAGLAAMEKKLNYILLEQDTVGGTLAHYPRGKIVMTKPAILPLVGKFQFNEASKEQLIEFWRKAIRSSGLQITTQTRVDGIQTSGYGFSLSTTRGVIRARTVLLALGRRGTPRTLGVPGEEQGKVVYRLIDAEQYRGKHVLVVGGGDSALEAALSVARESGTTVSISYRNEAFSRAKPKNRDAMQAAMDNNTLQAYLRSTVRRIEPTAVCLDTPEGEKNIPNDYVIVCAGGILPNQFLQDAGICVEKKFGTV